MATKRKNKPLIEMTKEELTGVFDDAGKSLREGMLKEARGKEGLAPLSMVVLLLSDDDGVERVIHYNPEYGDEEGWEHMEEFAAEIVRCGNLRKGERLRVVQVTCALSMMERVRSKECGPA